MPEALIVLDKDDRVLLTNPAARRLLESAALDPDNLSLRDFAQTRLEGTRSLASLPRAGGARTEIEIIVVAMSLDKSDGAERIAFLQDVTAQRQADLAYRHNAAFAQAAVEIGKLAYWEWDVASGHIVWSDKIYEILGLDPHLVKPSMEAFRERLHPEDADRLAEEVQSDLRGKGTSLHNYRIVRPDGIVRRLCARRVLIQDGQGNPQRVIGVVLDITE